MQSYGFCTEIAKTVLQIFAEGRETNTFYGYRKQKSISLIRVANIYFF